jgi:hypothetical protein
MKKRGSTAVRVRDVHNDRPTGEPSDGPLGPRTAYFDATRMGTFRGEVTAYEPSARIGFRETLRWFGAELMEARPEYVLEADGDRTIIHHVAEGELFGVMRLNEAGGGADGEERADADRRVAQAFAGIGLGPAPGDRMSRVARSGTRGQRVAGDRSAHPPV